MNFLRKIHGIIIDFRYGKLFEYVAAIFAMIYHIGFLLTFWFLGIHVMAYYNIFSVVLFTLILLFGLNGKSFLFPCILFYLEVITHQFLANYFLGAQALFHFMILMLGFLPLLCMQDQYKLSYVFALISSLIFIVLEVTAPYVIGKYEISQAAMTVIKTINVSSSILVAITCVFIFSYLVWRMRYKLEQEVSRKTEHILHIQNHIIITLANLVDNRDTDTGKHIQRTSAYVALISRKALEQGAYPEVITEDFIKNARLAAPLHDVGKIIIPDEILKKPGRFTPEEFEIMKRHASEGARIVDEVLGVSEDKYLLQIAEEIATGHHEKWDGSGYPYGIKGEEIPVSARIMAVADVFDALVSKRCYKDAMNCDEAFKIIQDGAGSHFDPEIVKIFLDQKEDIYRIMDTYKEI